jgi:hypothetical protein
VVLSSKGYWEHREDKSQVWKRDRVVADLEGNVLVTLDMKVVEKLIEQAFNNKNKRAVKGGLQAVVLNCREIPNSRREETV